MENKPNKSVESTQQIAKEKQRCRLRMVRHSIGSGEWWSALNELRKIENSTN